MAGTDANVHIILHGSKGDSEKLMLAQCENNENPFERGKTDQFTVESAKNVGHVSNGIVSRYITCRFQIERLTIGHDGTGAGAGWYPHSVEITCPSIGAVTHFTVDRWLASDEGDGRLEVTVNADVEMKRHDARRF